MPSRPTARNRPLLPSATRTLGRPSTGPAAPDAHEEQPDQRHSVGTRSRSRSYTGGAPGAVAQLGERRAGSAEARGSSPLGSTSKAPRPGAFPFKDAKGVRVPCRGRGRIREPPSDRRLQSRRSRHRSPRRHSTSDKSTRCRSFAGARKAPLLPSRRGRPSALLRSPHELRARHRLAV